MGHSSNVRHRTVVVVGSGFGGAMAAWPLVRAGHDVLMLERGPWVERGPHNWEGEGTITRTPFYESEHFTPARTEVGPKTVYSASCVGGPSVFYGAVSLRFREDDFRPNPEIVADSGARWPITYRDLRPFYDQAEELLQVAGLAGEDPTEPPRPTTFPQRANGLSPVSRALAGAARSMGLNPFRLPLAINYTENGQGRTPCQECATCDTFACAVGAKNDLATTVLSSLQRQGMELRPETQVVRLHREGSRVTGVECLDRSTGSTYTVTADTVVLAAGALGTPHLLLASGLEERNPAGEVVGRYLTRHCSGIAFGAYPWVPLHEGTFHKQIGINDFYLGDPKGRGPAGKLGNIQQTQTPHIGTVVGETGPAAGLVLAPLVRRATGLLVMAEDRPQYGNRVFLDGAAEGAKPPRLGIEHFYHDRDIAARRQLYARAREVHQAAGALATYVHTIHTFSHALGTVRMGDDEETAPLDAQGRFRGVDNLVVSDGSAFPTSAGVNPSLTIAANALRVGTILAERLRAEGSGARATGASIGAQPSPEATVGGDAR